MRREPTTYDGWRESLIAALGRAAGRLGARAGEWALAGTDLVVLATRVLGDDRVPIALRGELIGAAIFIVSPFEIVPAALFGPLGIVDEAVVLSRLLDALLNRVDGALVRELWPGDAATLARLQAVAGEGRRLFSTGARDGVRRLVSRGAGAARERLTRLLPGALRRIDQATGSRLALRLNLE